MAALTEAPAATAIFVDFDGTLADIVAAAADARPLEGSGSLLVELARTYGVVAVVSGRPVAFLAEHLPASVELHGLYGLESRVDGLASEHPGAAPWRAVVDEVAAEALERGPSGVDVEHKGLSLTLHVRRQPDLQPAVTAWAEAAARQSGLLVRRAKMSMELHPPVEVDKGTVVEARSAGMGAACYLGDDEGDLAAFDALDRLASAGVTACRVAVRSAEASPALLDRADVVVDGPSGAVAFLRELRSFSPPR